MLSDLKIFGPPDDCLTLLFPNQRDDLQRIDSSRRPKNLDDIYIICFKLSVLLP